MAPPADNAGTHHLEEVGNLRDILIQFFLDTRIVFKFIHLGNHLQKAQ